MQYIRVDFVCVLIESKFMKFSYGFNAAKNIILLTKYKKNKQWKLYNKQYFHIAIMIVIKYWRNTKIVLHNKKIFLFLI